MGPLFSWTAIAVIVLPPTILLACIGLAFLAYLVKYNLPVLPHGAHREHQENKVVEESSTAHISGDFVVFIIGVAVHNWLDVRGWWPVVTGFSKMMKELQTHPDSGYMGGHPNFSNPLVSVQYWRSVDSLMDYARAPSKEHFPVWVKMRSHMRQHKSFGIFHETFKVSAGQYETIYINMPPYGLSGIVGKTKLQGRTQTAKGRVGLTSGSDHPLDMPKRPF